MSIIVNFSFVCDLCGEEVENERQVLTNNPGLPSPIPEHAHYSRMCFSGFVLDLCGPCQQPLRDAFEARKLHLRSLGKLKGSPT